MAWRRLLGLALLWLCGVSTLSAQDAATRAALGQWRDSLDRIRDTTTLATLEQGLLAGMSQHVVDPGWHLRLGFLGLRRGALAGVRLYDVAAAEFQVAADLQPSWPLAWLGLGMAELRVAEHEGDRSTTARRRVGGDAQTRAATALARALRDDASLLPEVLGLVGEWRGVGVTARATVLRQVTRQVADQPVGRDRDLLVIRAVTERALASPDSAAHALELLLDQGDTTATLLLRLAVARFEAGRSDGVRPWLAGLSRPDPATLARYRAQIAPLLTVRGLAQFDRLPEGERQRWADSLMRRRDGLGLLGTGQRVLTHYQRLAAAQAAFVPADSLVPYLLRDTLAVLDDPRALLFLRQGAPTVLVDLPLPGLPPSASWRYGDAATGRVFHFVAPDSQEVWRRGASVGDLLGAPSPRGRSAGVPVHRDTASLRASRARLGGHFTDPSTRWDQLVAADRRSAVRAVQWDVDGDRVAPDFREPLPGMLTLVGLGGETAEQAEVQLLYAVPLMALRRVQIGVNPGVDVRLRAVLFTADSALRAILDTVTFVIPTTARFQRDTLYGRMPIPVAAGTMAGRALVHSGSAGLAMPEGVALHPGGGAGGVGVADLAFGWAGGHLSWVLPSGDTTWLAPTSTGPTGRALTVTTQLFGQPLGSTVQIETTVRQPRGGFVLVRAIQRLLGQGDRILRREVIEVPITRSAPWLIRPLDTAALPVGRYTVRVRMTTSSGRHYTRDRVLHLED